MFGFIGWLIFCSIIEIVVYLIGYAFLKLITWGKFDAEGKEGRVFFGGFLLVLSVVFLKELGAIVA